MFGLRLVSKSFATWVSENRFLITLVSAAVVVRIGVIEFVTVENWIDLKIFRSAGALVVEGINPYSLPPGDLPEAADAIRTSETYFDPWASDLSRWSYYVSSNPPLSTLLWGWQELGARLVGAKFAFIYFYSSVDFILFFLGLKITKALSGKVAPKQLIAISSLTILNPLLIWWGTVLPEDKQIQTALILTLVLLLVRDRGGFFLVGMISACLVLFKFVGFPLLIWAAWRLITSGRFRNYVLAGVGALLPVAISFLVFGFEFVEVVFARLGAQSDSGAYHESIFVLFPEATSGRLIIASLFVIAGILLSRNLGSLQSRWIFCLLLLSMAFTMILLVNGSWDRQLMGLLPVLIFIVASKASSSTPVLLSFGAVCSVYFTPIIASYLVSKFAFTLVSPLTSESVSKYYGPLSSVAALFLFLLIMVLSGRTKSNKMDRE